MCLPCETWLKDYDLLVRTMDSADAAIISSLEAAANRFLRGGVKPNSKVNQKATLEQIEKHSYALIKLLSSPEIEGSIADPFEMLAEVGRREGKESNREVYFQGYFQMLLSLELFAKHRITNKVEPEPSEEAVEKMKRRKEYPRFVLMADLLARHKQITGLTPAAYATTDRLGRRKRSEAVEFLSVAVPPILKAARVKTTHIDDQVLKLEIGRIKAEWEAGRNPEFEYTFKRWGSMVR